MSIRLTKFWPLILLVFIIGGIGWFILQPVTQPVNRGGRGPSDDGPVPVLAAKAERRAMPITVESIGIVQALNMVTVRSEVDGRLIDILFKDGQDVKAGDTLAQIDPTIYQAQYDQALAKKLQDEATLENAKRDLERYLNLAKTEFAPQQQADTQRAIVSQITAQIAADQAAINNAKAFLDRSTIKAPINGRTGIRLIDKGNLVRAADQTGLVTIAQIQPISIVITLPQQQLAAINHAMHQGGLPIDALDGESGTIIDRGSVEVVDNMVDQSSGTIKVKARFPNETLALWPGQFVNTVLHMGTLSDAIIIPTVAVQRGPTGPFVYVVNELSKVTVRPVSLVRQTETETAISSGIEGNETIVTSGFSRLMEGVTVRVDQATILPSAETVRQKGSGKRSQSSGPSAVSPSR